MERRRSEPLSYDSSLIHARFREHLVRSDLFASLAPRVQDALLTEFHFRSFEPQELLIQAGTPATTMFVILKGQVQVMSRRYESVLAELGPGMFFGEVGALFGVRRTADVVGKSRGLVAIIKRDVLKAAIGNDKILWNHIKGVAAARYRSATCLDQRRTLKLDPLQTERALLACKELAILPTPLVCKLAEVATVKAFRPDELVDFFSPRANHLLYVIVEGTVQVNTLDGASQNLGSGNIFLSFDVSLDYAKSLTAATLLMIDVTEVAALFAECADPSAVELGQRLLKVTDLSSQVNVNTSLALATTSSELASILNPAQFGRRRRASAPVFADLGRVKNADAFTATWSKVSKKLIEAEPESVNTNEDLKSLLLNAGIVLGDSAVLFHENRLNLAGIGQSVSDALLLSILRLVGAEVKVLNLLNCHRLTNNGIVAIWLHCPQLVKLCLSGCWNIDDTALASMSKSSCGETLREVNISHCSRLSVQALDHLAGAKLTKLDCSYCRGLDDRAWPALTQFAGSLRSLSLRRCTSITDASIEGIFSVTFGELEHLDLNECPFITDATITCIVQAAPRLRSLNLALDHGLRGNFLFHIGSSLAGLRTINICHLREVVDAEFCRRLADSCPMLEEVVADGCSGLDDDAVLALTSRLSELQKLSLSNCTNVSAEVLEIMALKYS